jgi:small subunit ribosomal protein S1
VGRRRRQVPGRRKFTGRVTNITDYGAFVELEPGIEGLVHVSEMSWTKKNVHPGKIVSTSQEVEVMVLDVDPLRSAASRSASSSAWTTRGTPSPTSTRSAPRSKARVKNITEFGLFVGLDGDIDGMVHLSDLDWSAGEEAIKDYKKGEMVKAKVLDVDVEKERISLGIKQLASDPFEPALGAQEGRSSPAR